MKMCGLRVCVFFFQAEDGIRDLVRSRGLGDVYKRQRKNGMDVGEMLGIEPVGVRMTTDQQAIFDMEADLSLIHI